MRKGLRMSNIMVKTSTKILGHSIYFEADESLSVLEIEQIKKDIQEKIIDAFQARYNIREDPREKFKIELKRTL